MIKSPKYTMKEWHDFQQWHCCNWISACSRMQIDPYILPCKKFQIEWIKDLNMKPDILRLIEEKVQNSLEVTCTRENFLIRTLIAQVLRTTVYKFDLIKLRRFCKAKDTDNRTICKSREWENCDKLHIWQRSNTKNM